MSTRQPSKRLHATLTVAICTRNRAATVDRCLRALDREQIAAFECEVVVVDNGSTDATSDVVRAYAEEVDVPVRLVSEPQIGLSHARNAAMAASRCDVITFLDDDCYVGKDYVRILATGFATGTFDYCGGQILRYSPTDQDWFVNNRPASMTLPPRRVVRPGTINGGNMAFRQVVCETVGPFDPMFGVGARFRCEDADYAARASAAGFAGAHLPELVVYHDHGRRSQAEVDGPRRANDVARGAFYAKHVLDGRVAYLVDWLVQAYEHKNVAAMVRELRGGAAYVGARLSGRRPDRS